MTRLISIHGFDPRGSKVGGIETHVRQLLKHAPQSMRPTIVGIDDFGDLPLGQLHSIEVAGRSIDFFPVVHIPTADQTRAATSIGSSNTFKFAKGLLRHMPTLRRMFGRTPAVTEIERFEYAPFAYALGHPFALVAHNEGDPRTDKMDSILSKHWYVNSIAEKIAVRLASEVRGVTPRIRDRLTARYPSQAAKIGVLTVSVDTQVFHPHPFDLSDGKLKLIYAGRLDEFKDPPLMFRVVERLHQQLGGQVEFHYCGSSDPHRFPEFTPIEAYTVRHGALTTQQVAEVMRSVHIGMLVSHWEGMPCFLLELLASGRPFGGLRLPQFDQVIEPGSNGEMVERADSNEDNIASVANAIVKLWADIKDGRISPDEVHQHIIPWSIDYQLRHFFGKLESLIR
ncbi:MAG TPA: glycosyltransferase [Sphingobium sp.]|uniref:glycosyltransferase n=1 Tax=Sphingobium sp. TaxID=1912891 RepID=UPI002ED1A257